MSSKKVGPDDMNALPETDIGAVGMFSFVSQLLSLPRTIVLLWSSRRKFSEGILNQVFSLSGEISDKIVISLLQNKRTALLEDPSNLFYHVAIGDLKAIQEKLFLNPERILERDPFGSSIIHFAYLFRKGPEQKEQMRRWLISNFPYEALELFSRKTKYSEEINPDYELPYTGENILHISIVNRDILEISWLLDFYKDLRDKDGTPCISRLLSARATGKFFRMGRPCYFGEFPLFFAVCSNDTRLVDAILEKSPWDAIFWTDSHGNTALHLCVIHDLQEMYTYIESVAKQKLREYWSNVAEVVARKRQNVFRSASNIYVDISDNDTEISHEEYVENLCGEELEKKVISELHRSLIRKRNNNKHSVITLAASKVGSVSMFKFLLEHKKSIRWIYGHVKAIYIDMTDLESIDADVRNKGVYGALEWLCIDEQYDKLAIPEIESIIRIKWTRVGRNTFLGSSLFSFVLACLTTILIIVQNLPWSKEQYLNQYYTQSSSSFYNVSIDSAQPASNSSLATDDVYIQPLSQPTIDAIAAIYVIVATMMVLEGIYVIHMMSRQRMIDYWGFYGSVRGAAQFDRIISTLQFFLFIGVCVAKINSQNFDSKVILSISGILAWCRQYYFLMGFANTGRLVLIISRMIKTDFVNFLQFFVVILFAFGSAFSLLSQISGDGTLDVENYATTLWYTLLYTLDNNLGKMADYSLPEYDSLMIVFNTLYLVFVNYLMFNMLIAMMNDTFQGFYDDSKVYQYCEKYNIMSSFDCAKTSKQLQDMQATYTMKKGAGDEVAYFEYKEIQPGWWNLSRNNSKDAQQDIFAQIDNKLKRLLDTYVKLKRIKMSRL